MLRRLRTFLSRFSFLLLRLSFFLDTTGFLGICSGALGRCCLPPQSRWTDRYNCEPKESRALPSHALLALSSFCVYQSSCQLVWASSPE